MAEKTIFQFDAYGFDLATTLFCGQSFSWQVCGQGVYQGVAGRYAAKVWQNDNLLFVQSLGAADAGEKAFWQHYFAVQEDYPALHAVFTENQQLAVCINHCPGIRMLRQPFWDSLLSFIISQNNHMQRIAGIASRLREQFGDKLAQGVYAFPTPAQLASQPLEALAPLRAGFRAKYLLDAAQKVHSGQVEEAAIRQMPLPQARLALQQIYGVGPKVADCVLLYGMGRDEIIPMDVWMKRAIQRIFPQGLPAACGDKQGIAQLYVFHWARENLPAKENLHLKE